MPGVFKEIRDSEGLLGSRISDDVSFDLHGISRVSTLSRWFMTSAPSTGSICLLKRFQLGLNQDVFIEILLLRSQAFVKLIGTYSYLLPGDASFLRNTMPHNAELDSFPCRTKWHRQESQIH